MSVEAESDEQVYAEADVITSADVYLPPASLAVSVRVASPTLRTFSIH